MLEARFDLLIRNGTVVDGTGAPGTKADLGVRGKTIAAVGDLAKASGALERYVPSIEDAFTASVVLSTGQVRGGQGR